MTGFPLFDLKSAHMEKVIRKVKPQSYRRLQQTCRGVGEFVRGSSTISICLDGTYSIRIVNTGERYNFPFFRIHTGGIDVDALYAARLQELCLPKIDESAFEPLCDILKNHMITCKKFVMERLTLSKEQCTILFNILKPIDFSFDSYGSNRIEALFPLKKMGIVAVRVDIDDAVTTVAKLISTCKVLAITTSPQATDHLPLLRTILQIIGSETRSSCISFDVVVPWTPVKVPTKDEFAEQLAGFKLKGIRGNEAQRNEEWVEARLDLPEHYRRSSTCVICIKTGGQGTSGGFIRMMQEGRLSW